MSLQESTDRNLKIRVPEIVQKHTRPKSAHTVSGSQTDAWLGGTHSCAASGFNLEFFRANHRILSPHEMIEAPFKCSMCFVNTQGARYEAADGPTECWQLTDCLPIVEACLATIRNLQTQK